jgi:hypothetical protein
MYRVNSQLLFNSGKNKKYVERKLSESKSQRKTKQEIREHDDKGKGNMQRKVNIKYRKRENGLHIRTSVRRDQQYMSQPVVRKLM